MKRSSKIMLLGAALWLGLGVPAGAQDQKRRTVIDLDTAVQKALALSPEIREARAALLFAEAQEDEAQANRWLQIELNALIGPVPDAKGDQIHSEDDIEGIDDLGIFMRADALATQPLYTFGRLSNYIKAAKKQIEVNRAGMDLSADEVILKTKEFYYGLQLALASRELVDEALGLAGKSLEKVEKQLELEESSATEMDLYKLQSLIGQVQALKAEADEGVELAQRALSAICGLDDPAPYPAEEHFAPVKADLKKLTEYQDSAMVKRPEVRQLKSGLEALESLVKAAEAERLPILYLGALFSAAWAPERDEVDNAFITDDFNHLYGGVALGVLWKFNFGIHQAKIDQAKAERLKYKAKENFAAMYLPLEVSRAYLGVVKAKKKIEATTTAYRSARRWFLAASSNYDLGLVESKEVSDSMLQYATQRVENYKAIHDYNVGWAKLVKVAGLSPGLDQDQVGGEETGLMEDQASKQEGIQETEINN